MPAGNARRYWQIAAMSTNEELLQALEQEMLQAAESLEFERAAKLRDRIKTTQRRTTQPRLVWAASTPKEQHPPTITVGTGNQREFRIAFENPLRQ